MQRFLIASLLTTCTSAAHATMLTFDNIPGATQNGYGAIGGYGGFTFGTNHRSLHGDGTNPEALFRPDCGLREDTGGFEGSALDSALSSIFRAVNAATAFMGQEYFPPKPTSR